MQEIFTVEEINLMCIFDTSSRTALLSDLEVSLPDVYDPDMRDVFHTAIYSLNKLTDTEFLDIGLYIADEYADEEDFAIAD